MAAGALSGGGNPPDSIADIITEIKNGDRHRVVSLAETYRHGRGIEKNILNALICYHMAGVDFELGAKRAVEENPEDEFAHLIDFKKANYTGFLTLRMHADFLKSAGRI